MTNKTKSRLQLLLALAVVFAIVWSCRDEDPTLADIRKDKLAFLEDSLRISDSLRLINSAGVVNYSITVVDGSSSTIFSNAGYGNKTDRVDAAVEGAIVTIGQFGKTESDTTDASGTVVFRGFFRTAVNVTIRRADFTTVSYVSTVGIQNPTVNGTLSFVGNLIPIFPVSGPRTATISGRATIQTDLTNKLRESVVDGTPVTVAIDARDSDFRDRFLMAQNNFSFNAPVPRRSDNDAGLSYDFYYVGNIAQASYGTGVIGATGGGNGAYSVTVPTAIDGLPLRINYSDIAADQRLFQEVGEDQNLITQRVIFRGDENLTAAALPPSSSADVVFESFLAPASATAVISPNTGTIERINVTAGGTGYVGVPVVEITGGGGTGATATATVAGGRVTGLTLTSAGTGYTSPPTVNIISGGTTATATSVLDATRQQVFSITVTAQGTGYTSAPTVVFTGGGGTGATASAQVANGRVVAVIVTNGGNNDYTGIPAISFTGGGGTGAAAIVDMGLPVAQVNMISFGSGHVYTPTVTFSAPFFSNGVRAQGQAIVDLNTRQVIGVLVTNPGSGYLAIAPPTVTINGGGGATAQAFLTGGSVLSFDITSPGLDYVYPPRVVIGRLFSGNGSGATGTAVMSGGRLVGINLTAGGSGYTAAPSVELEVGAGAIAYANVDANGAITSIVVANGGSGYTAAPRVLIFGTGSGATATAAVNTAGNVTSVTVTNGGSQYESGNTPAVAEDFSSTHSNRITTRPGLRYINDIYYGTGTIRHPN
jgi:hypothetical protein